MKFFVQDFCETVQARVFIFDIFVLFSLSPDFSSKISLQPFKIEISNLVYRFTTTSCDMGF